MSREKSTAAALINVLPMASVMAVKCEARFLGEGICDGGKMIGWTLAIRSRGNRARMSKRDSCVFRGATRPNLSKLAQVQISKNCNRCSKNTWHHGVGPLRGSMVQVIPDQ